MATDLLQNYSTPSTPVFTYNTLTHNIPRQPQWFPTYPSWTETWPSLETSWTETWPSLETPLTPNPKASLAKISRADSAHLMNLGAVLLSWTQRLKGLINSWDSIDPLPSTSIIWKSSRKSPARRAVQCSQRLSIP